MAFILDDILLAPIKLVKWVGEKLHEQARGELTDKSKIQEELLDLQMRLEAEEITEEEYDKREKELMERLNAIEEAEKE
ncbi:gas vesicle protein GvpG [bacterium]|nr:gas vesicle protein GvpG [bacterium]MCG2677134.1 gas vesicle protein GvpG [bacterium]